MLALANLRGRWASFVATFAALALGIALMATTLLVYTSSAPKVPDRVAGTPVFVLGPQTASTETITPGHQPWSTASAAELVGRLEGLSGVEAAVPDRAFYIQAVRGGRPVGDPEAPPAGHGWSSALLAPFPLVSGRQPVAPGEVVVDAGLHLPVGQVLPVLMAAGPTELTVVGTVSAPGFYVSDESATRLDPGVSAIGLLAKPGADIEALRAGAVSVVGSADQVVSGPERSVLEPEQSARIRWLGTQLLIAMVTLGCFVTVFVVGSTFALSAAIRRRELGLLRAVGATPRQVQRMILGEALLIWVGAVVVGVVLGMVATPILGQLLVSAGLEPANFAARVSAWPILVAAAVGLVVALLGGFAASRRAARVRPMEALRDADVDRRPMTVVRWIGGLGFFLTGAGLAVGTAMADAESRVNLALFTAMAFIPAAALLAPVVVIPAVRLVTWPLRRVTGATAMVLRAETLTAVRRTAATAAPIIATVGFAVLLSGMVTTMKSAYPAGQAAELRGTSAVVGETTPGLSEAVVTLIGPSASSTLPTSLFLERPDGTTAMVEASGVTGVAPGTAMFTPAAAAEHGLRAGGELPVTFVDGEREVLDVSIGGADAPADVVLSRELARSHDESALTDLAMVSTADTAGIRSADLEPLGAEVLDAQTYAERESSEDIRLLWLFALVLIGLSVGYTAIAVANTAAMAAQGRRRDFRVLASAGAVGGQVIRLVLAETGLVVGVGALLGLVVTLPGLAGMADGLREETGTPVRLLLHWPMIASVVAACLVLAGGASALIAARSLRRA